MKRVGILTFHDEVNYGSVLQAYAMQAALLAMGYDPVVIDRRLDDHRERVMGILASRSIGAWLRFFAGVLFFTGELSLFVRQFRSRKFIRNKLKLTSYSFRRWADAPKELGIDAITVGSDQVWHANICPDVYLLNGTPGVQKIAYAASFGMDHYPPGTEETYRKGYANFDGIGMREREGVEMVRALGFEAMHVVDPTLLAIKSGVWDKYKASASCTRRLVCYFLREDYVALLPQLSRFAKQMNCRVSLFTQDFALPMPLRPRNFMEWARVKYCQLFGRVDLRLAAGPDEFVSEIARGEWVVTNSFHALMFSTIFQKNVRVTLPSATVRKGMSARMVEFEGSYIDGPLIQPDIPSALLSITSGENVRILADNVSAWCEKSRTWLKGVLGGAV